MQDYRIAGLQNCRITGLQDYRITGLQDYRIAELQDKENHIMGLYQDSHYQRVVFRGKCFSYHIAYTFLPEGKAYPLYKNFFIRSLQGIDISMLNDKEKHIAQLCANGLCAKEIAGIVRLSTSAVNFYIRRFTKKTHSSNKTEAVAKMICYGMLLQ